MDLNIILALITFAILFVTGLAFYLSSIGKPKPAVERQHHEQAEGQMAGGRVQAARNQRARMRANARQRHDTPHDEDAHEEEADHQDRDVGDKDPFAGDAKLGAKKRAKLEAKAEKKLAREAEEHLRQEKKVAEQAKEEERKKIHEKEKAEELEREEQERKEIEERERREQEEYLQMKAAFSVEGEGFDEEGDNDGERNLLQEFVHFIKSNKVVVIEDLAAHFKLKTQAAIDRIATLQADGLLTGVVDDRGKFIYISQKELENVAKFIKQRGRVSITDLVESSNELINLIPSTA